MKDEHIELFVEAAKRLRFGAPPMTRADYLLKVLELKMRKGPQMQQDELEEISRTFKRHGPHSISVSTEDFMGEEILRDWLTTPEGDEEGRRYLLVNGLIPLNKENAQGLEFSIDAECLPDKIQAQLLEISKDNLGEFEEDAEVCGFGETKRRELDSARIINGRISGFKFKLTRRVDLEETYSHTGELDVEE